MKAIEKVTEILQEMVKQNTLPWVKNFTGIRAVSHTTGKEYSLLNYLLLGAENGEYATFNQVQKEGGKVRKGAKGKSVMYWSLFTPKDAEVIGVDDEGNEIKKSIPVLKYFTVFNIEDCEGITPKINVVLNPDFNPVEELDRVSSDYMTREGIRFAQDKDGSAYYMPALDEVHLPNREQFKDEKAYYHTLFHELVHSTGAKSRLNRDLKGMDSKESYSVEELVAEIGATMLMAEFGMDCPDELRNSAAYIQSWGRFIQDNAMAFVSACSRAEKAVAFILGREATKEAEAA